MEKVEKQNHYRLIHQLPVQDNADAILAEILHPEGKLISFAGIPSMYDRTSMSLTISLPELTGFAYRRVL